MAYMNKSTISFFSHLKKKLSFVFMLFLINSPVRSQLLEFKNYTTRDGLITNDVYNLYQDRQGYIWVFSPYGTLKYDGTGFKQVLKNIPFKDSFIYTICENKKGRKWIANCNARIYEIRNDSAIMIRGFEAMSDSMKNAVSEIVKLHVDDSLNIYALTKGHSYKFVPGKNGYHSVHLCDRLQSDCALIKTFRVENELLQIVGHIQKEIYHNLCGKSHIYLELVKDNKHTFIPLPFNYLKSNVRHVKEIDGFVYFSLINYLGKVDRDNKTTFRKISKSVILNYTRDRNGHAWVGCLNDGLYELNENDSVVNHYFENTTINDVLVDHRDELWISTPGKGLFHSQDINYRHPDEKKLSGVVISMIKKVDDELFIANAKGDLFFIKNTVLTNMRTADDNSPLDIIKHNKHYLVACRFDLETFDLHKRPGAIGSWNEPTINTIIAKNSDTLIYIWRKGVTFSVKNHSQKRLDLGRKIFSGTLLHNTLWLGTENGVYTYKTVFTGETRKTGGIFVAYEKDSLWQPGFLKPTQNSNVVHIEKDGPGTLWFCTEGSGLFKLVNNRLVNYNINNGLPSNIINWISFTPDHSVLLSTNKGLFMTGTDKTTGAFKEWTSLYDGEVQKALLFENKIYLVSQKELLILDYNKEKTGPGKVFFNLAGIYVDSNEVSAVNFNMVKSTQHSIEFKFDCISFSDDRPAINYVLSGPSKDVGLVKDNNVRFNRLVHGSYTLSAFPVVKNGERLKIVIPFTVEPTFWQTFFFRILFALLLISTMPLTAWLISRRNRHREAIKAKNEQLILEYKLIALKAQINPHFISNCLAAIQELVVDNNTDKATFYIAKFGLLVRQILDFSSMQLISLGEELDLLGIYMELEQLRFENAFVFKVAIENGLLLKEIFVPPLILNPIVENAIWHGLLPVQSQRQGELAVTIKTNNNELELSVIDNGVGRNTNKKEISNSKGASYGIKITEQRLSNINYLYKQNNARMIYTDLYDMHKKASGTRVTIFLPHNLMPSNNE